MSINPTIPKIGPIEGLGELRLPGGPAHGAGTDFGRVLADAIRSVDGVQKEAEAAQVAYASGAEVDLHDVLIKVEEAELAFKTMMEVRTKLVDAYREVMRIGGGG